MLCVIIVLASPISSVCIFSTSLVEFPAEFTAVTETLYSVPALNSVIMKLVDALDMVVLPFIGPSGH